jgi:iron complex transport system substrate-binding protein
VLRLPSVTAAKFEDARTGAEIDVRVRSLVRYGLTGGIPFFHRWTVRPLIRDALSIHKVDADVLRALKPDIILTQEHSVASGVSLVDVEAAICVWQRRPVPIVSLSARSLADAYGDIGKIAQALDVPIEGGALVRRMQERIAAVESRVAHKPKPSVAFLVWLEPLMVAGDWMPALVEEAGGRNLFEKTDAARRRYGGNGGKRLRHFGA